jgi:hypothetical protein
MTRIWTAVLLLAVGGAGLAGCFVVSPYPPGYVAPYPPPYAAPVPPPPRATVPAPAAPGTAPGMPPNCQTVTVEGHNETRVTQDGRRETVWIPTHQQRVCQ